MLKYIFLLLFAAFLFSYFRPAVHMHFSVLMIERTSSFSFATFFERNNESPLNLDLAGTDFSTLFEDSDLTSVGVRVGVSVFAYFAALVLVLVVFGLTAAKRFGRGRMVLVLFAMVLHLLAGWLMKTVPPLVNEILDATINNVLGFFALFIDTADIITLTLGWGYWMTAVVMGLLFFTLIKERVNHGNQ